MSHTTLKFTGVLIGALLTCTATAGQISQYLPQLTGSYTVGDYPQQYGGNATLIETSIGFHWQESVAPRYLNYEIAGVMGAPVPSIPGNQLDEINFNGGYSYDDGPGMGWGMSLNTNFSLDNWYRLRQVYDPQTGRFYFGLSMDAAYYWNWNPTTPDISANVHAVFYNYWNFEGPTSYLDNGFVFVESARVGISSTPFAFRPLSMEKLQPYPGSEQDLPEPASAALLCIAAVGMIVARKNRRRHVSASKELCGYD